MVGGQRDVAHDQQGARSGALAQSSLQRAADPVQVARLEMELARGRSAEGDIVAPVPLDVPGHAAISLATRR